MILQNLGRVAGSGAVVLVALHLGGCGAEAAPSQRPALTAYSGGSGSGSGSSFSGSMSGGSGSGGEEVRFGSGGQSGLGISVRPDTIEVPFAVAALGTSPIDAAQAEITKMTARLAEGAGSAPKLQLKSLNLSKPSSGGKAAKETDERKATAEGCLVFAIAPEADYWARAKVLDGIVRASGRFTADVVSAKDEKERTRVVSTIGAPLLKVKDAEAHRAALTKRMIDQSRALATEVDPRGKLALEDCAMPQPVQQAVVGPEEVVLSLPLQCKVQAGPERK